MHREYSVFTIALFCRRLWLTPCSLSGHLHFFHPVFPSVNGNSASTANKVFMGTKLDDEYKAFDNIIEDEEVVVLLREQPLRK